MRKRTCGGVERREKRNKRKEGNAVFDSGDSPEEDINSGFPQWQCRYHHVWQPGVNAAAAAAAVPLTHGAHVKVSFCRGPRNAWCTREGGSSTASSLSPATSMQRSTRDTWVGTIQEGREGGCASKQSE